jgi:mono/diheme cytochrome c family protein
MAGFLLLMGGASPPPPPHPALSKKKSTPIVDIPVRPIDLTAARKVSFTRDIFPILRDTCWECHGSKDPDSDLRAISVETLLKGGEKNGPAVIPGKPDDSPIVKYVRGIKHPQMPKEEPTITADQLHAIRQWIAAGAVDDSSATASAHADDALKDDPAAQALLGTMHFSGSAEQRAKHRRQIRLALVPPPAAPPTVQGPVNNPLDQFILASWAKAKLPQATHPPELCDDSTFLRRVYLDLIGVIPTIDEARKFVEDPSPGKRAKVIDELLARNDDYAAHWAPFWQDALGSTPQAGVGGVNTRGNYDQWIYQSFRNNTPFDEMVMQLIDPTLPGHPEGYVRSKTHEETLQSAAGVGQVFLGTGMKCASCHSHFENREWPQARFLAFAGLFGDKDLELIRCEKHSGQFIPAAFPFSIPDAPVVTPKSANDRLHRLAQLLTDPADPRFARSIVNRLWKRYIGLGLFEPVDDYRLDRPPAQPELLDWLAYDFMQHDEDLKHTIRLILNSRTYQLRYDPALEDHFDVTKPSAPRFYRSPSLRRLTAEELIDSMRLATSQHLDSGKRAWKNNESTALTRALGKSASRNDISTGRPEDVAVVQALELLNGGEFHQLAYSGPLVNQVNEGATPTKMIDTLYWAALGRPATAQEVELGARFLAGPGGQSTQIQAPPVHEIVWVDDDLPPGAHPTGAWKWVTRPETVFSGERAHVEGGTTEPTAQHYFQGVAQPLNVNGSCTFYAYAYLDPANPPKEIMLQWHHGEWDHRAYWGKDIINFGTSGTSTRHPMGDLPKTGQWVRLEVPASAVGFTEPADIDGMSFDQAGGKVTWDKAGIMERPASDPNQPQAGDVLWALFASPEFQYIR